VLALPLFAEFLTMNAPGLVSIRSGNSVKVMVDRLETSLKASRWWVAAL
jgi:hypothetical protein